MAMHGGSGGGMGSFLAKSRLCEVRRVARVVASMRDVVSRNWCY